MCSGACHYGMAWPVMGINDDRSRRCQSHGSESSVKAMFFLMHHGVQQRILHHYSKQYKVLTVARLLQEEQLKASRVGVAKF